jgi:hypothetical protein
MNAEVEYQRIKSQGGKEFMSSQLMTRVLNIKHYNARSHFRRPLLVVAQALFWIGAAMGQARIDPNLAPGSQPLTRHRAFFVLPDEATVNNYGDLPEASHPTVAPLTSRQKFQLFAEETFDPGVVLIAAGLAGLQQAGNLRQIMDRAALPMRRGLVK